MVHHNVGQHHINVRKRIHQKHQQYPHPNKYKAVLDRMMYPIGLIGPVMMVPQIVKIFVEQDASSIALSSWLLFLFPAFLWVMYGVAHKDKVIILCNAAWFLSYTLVIIGAIIY